MEQQSTNLNVKSLSRHEHADLEQARQKAQQRAGGSGGIAMPCTEFRQGKRDMFAGALPVHFVANNLTSQRPTSKKASLSEVSSAKNRPLNEEHAEGITQYIKENAEGTFILPPLTLNVRDKLYFHTYRIDGDDDEAGPTVRAGFLIIPREALIDITDGQHRAVGIGKAYENPALRSILAKYSVPVMITTETDIHTLHQDFADAARVKPIAPSQLAAYDRRNPANALVLGLEARCRLFTDKLDATSSKPSKGSPYPWLANHVRQAAKILMFGTNADSDNVFEEKARKELGDGSSAKVANLVELYGNYIDRATFAIPQWKLIADADQRNLHDVVQGIRTGNYVHMMGTGFLAVMRVIHMLINSNEPLWQKYIDRMSEIDWTRRTGEGGWHPRVVPDQHKVNTGYAAVKFASDDIMRWIGWASLETEDVAEEVESTLVVGRAM